MTAPRGSMSDEESSSGGSDAEELARCREAAVPAWGVGQRPRGPEKKRADAANNQLPTTQPSLRHKVDEHEQDGNELQTTPEFRAYVAKKLGDLLDSHAHQPIRATICKLTQPRWQPAATELEQAGGLVAPMMEEAKLPTCRDPELHSKQQSFNYRSSITISEAVKEPTKAEVQKATPEDDGFRLFFTSVPEGPEETAAPQLRRKRLPSRSSEDSDEEWQRCQEAAVSASAILQESAIHGPVEVEKEAKKKKRKLKKKAKKEASTDLTTATTITSKATAGKQGKESAKLNGDLVSLGTKKKKRKKKAKRAIEASPFPPSKSAAAASAH
ncbi:protein CUSTOS isoform X2 [Myotis yumanensis]|uniref:protein CUSTOS isoform X2 n=1 Tax=Myotis yumanensis TaxID=159337 RepID=UPI0038D44FFA